MLSEEIKIALGGLRFWLYTASFIIIIAGIKAAATIIVPLLMALFIAAICAPLLFWLNDKGIPQGFSILIVIFTIILVSFIIIVLLGTSVSGFSQSLPFYEERLRDISVSFLEWMKANKLMAVETKILDQLDPSNVMRIAGSVFTGFSQMLSRSLIILILVIFILFELTLFKKKLRVQSGSALRQADRIVDNLNRYFGIKTLVSLATGIIIGIALHIVGVDFPYLWGALAFLLNFIPNIGSIIAAIPPALLALIQFGSFEAIIVVVIFTVVNFTIGSAIEPKLMGSNLGLSTLVVFLSLIFWGWVLGTVGMLLSIPLTMTIKIVLDNNPSTRWVGVLVGDEKTVDQYIEESKKEIDDKIIR